jgi:hypothetical protein
MSAPIGSAAPASGTSSDDIPSFEELLADPEIAALLDFEPVPMNKRVNGWDADAQRAFVALIAATGSKNRAAAAIRRHTGGLKRIRDRPDAAGFANAIDAALELAGRRSGKFLAGSVAAAHKADPHVQAPGQRLNEFGEWEDEESLAQRAEQAMDSIRRKLANARRLYLQEISADPGKRAAFEILTELPIDWKKAERLEPQEFEPWLRTNQRQPDMILTAESGWSAGEIGYGPDRKRAMQEALNQHRMENGLEPIDWSAEGNSAEHNEQSQRDT